MPETNIGFLPFKLASHFQLAAIGAEPHQRAVARTIPRIGDGAVLVRISVPPHPGDYGQAQKACAFPFGLLALVVDVCAVRGRKCPDNGALIDPVALRDLEPALGAAGLVIDLLPQTRGREIGCSPFSIYSSAPLGYGCEVLSVCYCVYVVVQVDRDKN
jgi:hypothetical protein